MNEEFVNTYIEMMNNKLTDLVKNEILLQTRLAIAEKVIASLQSDNEKLQSSLNKKTAKTKEDF
jgi:uncharacterized protein YqgQ